MINHAFSIALKSTLDVRIKAPPVNDDSKNLDSGDGGIKPVEHSGTLSRCSRMKIGAKWSALSVAPGHSLSGSRSSRLKTDASLIKKALCVSGDGGSSIPVLSTSAIGMNMNLTKIVQINRTTKELS